LGLLTSKGTEFLKYYCLELGLQQMHPDLSLLLSLKQSGHKTDGLVESGIAAQEFLLIT
jgi:hypothetical protein